MPEWRKQLSQRVREVQEQRAREAAEAEAEARASESVSCALPSGQLELVPDREQSPMNPIVSKALQRVDRARRGERQSAAALATATAPALEPLEEEVASPQPAEVPSETKPKLTIVASMAHEEVAPRAKPVRLISDDDASLSYLESYLSISEETDAALSNTPGFARRAIAAVFDLIVAALFASPAAAVVELIGASWTDPKILGMTIGSGVFALFVYLTVAIGLTGRTIGMRIFSMRVIDLRTRLIPTGGQSINRSLAYILGMLVGGLGVLFALIDRDGRTVHDRFSKTIVIHD